jgi:hypothetical protein
MRTVKILLGAVLSLAVATPAHAVPAREDLMIPATSVAARSDRRPVAGGVHDATVRRTFISWAGQFEDNYVQGYDHRTRTWSDPVRVAGGDNDSHNYPTMIQAGDGHLLVFRGLHNRELWVARSPRPHSIEGTWTDVNIAEGLGATAYRSHVTLNPDDTAAPLLAPTAAVRVADLLP